MEHSYDKTCAPRRTSALRTTEPYIPRFKLPQLAQPTPADFAIQYFGSYRPTCFPPLTATTIPISKYFMGILA